MTFILFFFSLQRKFADKTRVKVEAKQNQAVQTEATSEKGIEGIVELYKLVQN